MAISINLKSRILADHSMIHFVYAGQLFVLAEYGEGHNDEWENATDWNFDQLRDWLGY